ncbi:hypothetical protein [Streptomyces syringium]|uniref:hypothetical protein n=1 Tax=Streptomyces syringium TaxID=76729 RepID=UPI0033CDF0A5
MNDAVDADELLRRIRRARDCAAAEDERFSAAANSAEEGSSQAVGYYTQAVVFNAIKSVLDEIIDPGKHFSSD